jgi:DNA gyrase subunit B
VSTYDASVITLLSGMEAIRRRPAMYVGSTGAEGVHHLVREVVQNAVDEALAGYCKTLAVRLEKDGAVTVEDDGRGIPVEVHPIVGRPACEVVLTTLHSGGKFTSGAYRASGGLHGVGLVCVNALSSSLALDIWRDGGHYHQEFQRGAVTSPLARLGSTDRRGTRLTFVPDPVIFTGSFDPGSLREELLTQSFLNPGLTVRFDDGLSAPESWKFDSGVAGLVEHLNAGRTLVHKMPIHLQGTHEGIVVQVALQWTTAYDERVLAFVNNVPTPQGGTSVDGLHTALTQVVNQIARERGISGMGTDEDVDVSGGDVREGLTAVLVVRLDEPEFEGQTKTKLTSQRAQAAVETIVKAGLLEWLRQHGDAATDIVERAFEASRARAAARRASERAHFLRGVYEPDREVYRRQFGVRSKNWHESARWITDGALLAAHAAACKVGPESQVLDVCCGSGVVGASFRGLVGKITGLDLTPQMAELARQRLDEVHLGDVYALPFPDASFDLVVNREVLHLLPQPERPLQQIARVLKPGGQFIVGQWVPFGPVDSPWMFRIVKKKQPLFCNNLTVDDMRGLITAAGLTRLEITEYLQWEDIDTWIDTWETPSIRRHEIRELYYHAPAEIRAVHPIRVHPNGRIEDCWRWCIFSAFKE